MHKTWTIINIQTTIIKPKHTSILNKKARKNTNTNPAFGKK